MSKRIIAIALALVLLVCLLAIPVAADSADENLPYIELTKFDDTLLSGIAPGAFYVMGDYGYVLDFSLTLGQINAYGYEVTYSYSGNRPNVTGTSFGNTSDNAFNSRYVDGTNLGKIRGTFRGVAGSDFGISFNSAGCYITVHSVRVFVVDNYQVSLSAELYGNGQQATWYPGSSISVATTNYSAIYIDSWRNYDIINLSATLGGYGITSVTARLVDNTDSLDDIVIPFEMNYVNFSDYDGEHENVLLTMSCDMRGVDPATAPDSTLIISITTAVPSGYYGYIQPTSIYGSVLIESPDVYLPFLRYILYGVDSIQFLTDTIVGSVAGIYSSLIEGFNDVNENIAAFSSNVSALFGDMKTFLTDSWNENFEVYKTWFAEISLQKLAYQYDYMFLPVKKLLEQIANSTPADETVTQGMQDSANSLGSLGEQMSAGTPDIAVDDVNVDMNSLVSAGGMTSATNLAVVVTSQSLVQQMLLIVISLALVGFVFFGKRG